MIKSSKINQAIERKGFKFKVIIPNSETERKLLRTAGCCRKVWNLGLAMVKADDEEYREQAQMLKMAGATDEEIKRGLQREFKFNPYQQLSAMLPIWKSAPETSYLTNAYSKSLQIKLEELGLAITEAKTSGNIKCYPRIKKRGVNDSFSFNGTNIKHDAQNGRIYIPKIGYVRYIKSRDVLGTIKNVTISRSSNEWFVSLQTEKPLSAVNPELVQANKIIAIDMGITKVVSFSDQVTLEYKLQKYNVTQIDGINPLEQALFKLATLQRELARKIKFSQNWRKVKAKVTKLHTKIANIRKDFLHKVTTAIAANFAYVAIEDLKIKNMTSSASGTLDNPGTNVAQKSGLNRSILDQGWGMFKSFLTYKLKYMYNTELIKVNPKHTSQKCSQCNYIHKDNRKTQADFVCKSCGHAMNADINAALNIKSAGIAVLFGTGTAGTLACDVGVNQLSRNLSELASSVPGAGSAGIPEL